MLGAGVAPYRGRVMDPRRSPFAAVRPAVVIAGAYAAALAVWMVAGDALPGGRWFAVHLFTLGVLSNLVMAMTQHFAETLLHQPGSSGAGRRTALFNAGALAVLVGMPAGTPWLVACGATAASAAVMWLYVHLRRTRRGALSQRFAFLVRAYERAAGAFLHGAILGALLGAGVLPGTWAGTARLAHLHVNILGWGGLTLLSTLVVFGPTVLRRRMESGADATAARWLRSGATGLTVGVFALLLTALPAPWGVVARVLAGAGLAVFAMGCTAVCLPVLRAARRAKPSANGLTLAAACAWFPAVTWADVIVIGTGRYWLLTSLGAALIVGVLGQAILATVGYLGPMLSADSERRSRVRERLNATPLPRVVIANLAVAAIVAGTAMRDGGLATVGWAGVALSVVVPVALSASKWQKSLANS